MKTFFKAILAVSAICFMALSCSKSSDTSDLQKQIDELKSVQIASINTQITNIKTSLGNLEAADGELRSMINDIKSSVESIDGDIDELIQNLESIDAALNLRIDQLKTYCDNQDNDVKNWVSITFATLEQHSAVLTEIANIKTQLNGLSQSISTLDTSLSQKISDAEASLLTKISDAEDSVKSWVNEQLTGYYTIAQVDAKVKALEDAYKAADQTITGEISSLTQALNKAKTDLTAAYQAAITTAITENNGTINQKIADDIKAASDALQAKIDTINGRLDAIESRLDALEAQVAELIGMVQSIVVVPDYSDGSVKLTNTENNVIRFEVYPLEAAAAIAEKGPSILSLDYIQTITKSSSELQNLPITAVAFDNDMLSITVDGTDISEEIIQGVVSANARLKISDGNIAKSSEYFLFNTKPLPDAPSAIDLGLSVKWADRNVGAETSFGSGVYYAWGEIDTKVVYSWKTYKWCNDTYYSLTKYNTSDSYGTIDMKPQLESADDVAHVKYGGKWRIPTESELDELIATKNNPSYNWEWKSFDGQDGWHITYIMNNQSIFLPATDYNNKKAPLAHYWSSSLFADDPKFAWHMDVTSTEVNIDAQSERAEGFSIRPVLGNGYPSIKVGDIWVDYSGVTNASVQIFINNGNGWSSSVIADGIVVTAASIEGSVVTYSVAPNQGLGRVGKISVVFTKKGLDEVIKEFCVNQYGKPSEAIDLGLSVKWASCNIGASSPEYSGNYYAWGEIEPKDCYSWETYIWCYLIGKSPKFTKYNHDSDYAGIIDNKYKLDPSDDVAHVTLGGKWRMPTFDEKEELRNTKDNNSYNWQYTYLNGQHGLLITYLKNNQSVFFPSAGYIIGYDHEGGLIQFWCSEYCNPSYPSSPSSASGYQYGGKRCYGLSVRPVLEK